MESTVTVGALRHILSDYHDSDLCLIYDAGFYCKVKIDKIKTDHLGMVVVMEPGERTLVDEA
jgi:hypothetical protein